LDKIFELGKGKIRFYVDFKAGIPKALIEAMRRHNVVDDCIIYGDPEILHAIKALEPATKLMPGLSDPAGIDDLIEFCQPYAFDAAWRILSKEMIEQCHRKGVKVFSDAMGGHETVEDFRQAMEWGIDCIQTDEPLILLRAIELYVRFGED